jgi:hypothetical protein
MRELSGTEALGGRNLMTDRGPAPVVQGINLAQLRKEITKSFTKGELNTLCFDLNIEYEDLSGDRLEDKARELVQYCRRRGRLLALVQYCREVRPHIGWSQAIVPEETTVNAVEQRIQHRHNIEERCREVYLVHAIRRSRVSRRQWFDILIYLVRHCSDDLSEVDYAEFFLGRHWNNRIFKVENRDNFVGISIYAYGPVLCTCRVVFSDGYQVMLDRYIDFEMAETASS